MEDSSYSRGSSSDDALFFWLPNALCLIIHLADLIDFLYIHVILIYLACVFPGVTDHWYPADLFRRAKIHSVLDWHHSNLRSGAGQSASF
ncbi:Glutathione S-transferase T3 [Linum grandiflorum]